MYDVGFMQIPKEKESTTHSNIEARDLLSVWIARSLRELTRLVCPSPLPAVKSLAADSAVRYLAFAFVNQAGKKWSTKEGRKGKDGRPALSVRLEQ